MSSPFFVSGKAREKMYITQNWYHVSSDLEDLFHFLNDLGIVKGPDTIPLYKILFTLHRKGFLATVLVETDPTSQQYADECRVAGKAEKGLRRLHFFAEKSDFAFEKKGAFEDAYGGYCDIRPTGTICSAFITAKTITNSEINSYAFIPASINQTLKIPIGPDKIIKAVVQGFHYMQKNGRETMCSQAALDGIVKYWQHKLSSAFQDVNSTIDINAAAGFSVEAQKAKVTERGLSQAEINTFLSNDSSTGLCLIRDYSAYTLERKKREHVIENIYSFIESGCPVIVSVQVETSDGIPERHALTLIGHTFDKNNWRAMADIEYIAPPEIQEDRQYYSNTTWVQNFIVHDDNFGPYYFMTADELRDHIATLYTLLPTKNEDMIFPNEVANLVARSFLSNWEFRDLVNSNVRRKTLIEENRKWHERFFSHLKVEAGDGLVLRPLLVHRKMLLNIYKNHEFLEHLKAGLHKSDDEYVWLVEMSWPHLYCFQDCACSLTLTDIKGTLLAAHLPGLFVSFEDPSDPKVFAAEKHDPPFSHYQPGLIR